MNNTKVIVALSDSKQIITTQETAELKGWLVTYKVTVKIEKLLKPVDGSESKVPVLGSLLKGTRGHVYCITYISPVHKCAVCSLKGKARVHTKFYCKEHYHNLVVTKPILKVNVIPQRNAPCYCGSNRKYKHCCFSKNIHSAKRAYNSNYKSNK